MSLTFGHLRPYVRSSAVETYFRRAAFKASRLRSKQRPPIFIGLDPKKKTGFLHRNHVKLRIHYKLKYFLK